MPEFETPEPIAVTIELAAGSVRVRATDRTDTLVDVRPHNTESEGDVQAATQTEVEYTGGRLTVRSPRNRLRQYFGSNTPRVDVTVDLPAGSDVTGSGWADYLCEGRLGTVELADALGDVRVEHAARLHTKSAMGDIIVGRVDGPADVRTAIGEIRIGQVAGAASAKTSTGNVTIGEAGAHLRLKTASGTIEIDHAAASVDATTPAGAIRIGEVGGGTIDVRTSYGQVEIGVPEGVAAWLDMTARSGRVHSELASSGEPTGTDRRVEIRAHTGHGDILVRRA